MTIRRTPAVSAGVLGYGFPGICRKRNLRDQFTVDAPADPRELLARKGHDSARAVLIYLHSSAERQRVLANEVGRNAKTALSKPKRSGTRKAGNES